MNYTKEQRDAILSSSWPHVKALIDAGDIKGAVKNYVHCGCYIGLSKKAKKIISVRSKKEYTERILLPDALNHEKETDRLCLEYRKLIVDAEKKRIAYEKENKDVKPDNDIRDILKPLVEEINCRRVEWIHLFGSYYSHLNKTNRHSEYAKAFCKMFRHQLFGNEK